MTEESAKFQAWCAAYGTVDDLRRKFDGEGTVTTKELRTVMRSPGQNPTDDYDMSENEAADTEDEMDRTHKGRTLKNDGSATDAATSKSFPRSMKSFITLPRGRTVDLYTGQDFRTIKVYDLAPGCPGKINRKKRQARAALRESNMERDFRRVVSGTGIALYTGSDRDNTSNITDVHPRSPPPVPPKPVRRNPPRGSAVDDVTKPPAMKAFDQTECAMDTDGGMPEQIQWDSATTSARSVGGQDQGGSGTEPSVSGCPKAATENHALAPEHSGDGGGYQRMKRGFDDMHSWKNEMVEFKEETDTVNTVILDIQINKDLDALECLDRKRARFDEDQARIQQRRAGIEDERAKLLRRVEQLREMKIPRPFLESSAATPAAGSSPEQLVEAQMLDELRGKGRRLFSQIHVEPSFEAYRLGSMFRTFAKQNLPDLLKMPGNNIEAQSWVRFVSVETRPGGRKVVIVTQMERLLLAKVNPSPLEKLADSEVIRCMWLTYQFAKKMYPRFV